MSARNSLACCWSAKRPPNLARRRDPHEEVSVGDWNKKVVTLKKNRIVALPGGMTENPELENVNPSLKNPRWYTQGLGSGSDWRIADAPSLLFSGQIGRW